jgi:hypothetical protein
MRAAVIMRGFLWARGRGIEGGVPETGESMNGAVFWPF